MSNYKKMNKKIILLTLKFLFVFGFTQILNAQLYSNGPISTGVISTSGVGAPAGYTWSELQQPNSTLGAAGTYNNDLTTNFSLADDFVVPAGLEVWYVTSVNVFGYQTSFTGTVPPIDVLRVRIWNGDPTSGTSTVVAGDLTTNRYNATNSVEAFVYRTTTITGTNRKVWKFSADLTTTLLPGTYWIEFQAHTTNDAPAFFPPVTILNTIPDSTWNAKRSTAGVFANLVDFNTNAQLAIPFEIIGTTTPLGVNENSFEASISFSPNPVKNILTISNALLETINQVEIFDINSRLIQQIDANQASVEVDLTEFSKGIYVVKITTDDVVVIKKIVKE
jgi:hypothetical protein